MASNQEASEFEGKEEHSDSCMRNLGGLQMQGGILSKHSVKTNGRLESWVLPESQVLGTTISKFRFINLPPKGSVKEGHC